MFNCRLKKEMLVRKRDKRHKQALLNRVKKMSKERERGRRIEIGR